MRALVEIGVLLVSLIAASIAVSVSGGDRED